MIKFCLIPLFFSLALLANAQKPWDPATYPDDKGFEERREILVEGLATGSLQKWRQGYFSGGDPGKFLPGHAMAKLLLDPKDAEAFKYMNDDRSYREHYHFAALNWARFYPLFGETVLTEETRRKFIAEQKKSNYTQKGGTENHRTMWWSSAGVLPHYTGVGTNHVSKGETLRKSKALLHGYVKNLYMVGQGEWDSSTYHTYTVNGLLNLYDFSKDPEVKLLAQAGLDILIAAYALKYTDGVFTGPNQRGYASVPYRADTDQTGYLWWGGNQDLTPTDTRNFRSTVGPITSTWRPGRVLHNLAKKNLPELPVEQRNSKANYWHGWSPKPEAGNSHETVYLAPKFTMGSLWDAHASQHTRFQIAVSSSEGAVTFTGGHPRKSDHLSKRIGVGYADGTGRYVQSAQSGPVYLCMVKAPDNEPEEYAYFTIPETFAKKGINTIGDWKVFDVEGVQVAVRPFFGEMTKGETKPDKKGNVQPILKAHGHQTGFLVWVLEDDSRLASKLSSVRLDASDYVEDGFVSVNIPGVTQMEATFVPGPGGYHHGTTPAQVKIDGEEIELSDWDIYSGPFVTQTPGVLTVSDGKEAFRIDFTGDLPVYSEVSAP